MTMDPEPKAPERDSEALPQQSSAVPPLDADAPVESVREIPLALIDPSPYQARTHLQEAGLVELAASIHANGLVQPVVVRCIDGGRYQLIAGHRRRSAAQRVGKTTIPAVVRQVSDAQAMEMILIENLQRQDLNAMEQAHAFERLSREFALTQEQMAERTGKDRSSISNFLRLLQLPEYVQSLIERGALSAGHGKALLMLHTETLMVKMAERIYQEALSVEQTRQMVLEWIAPSGPKPPKRERRHSNVKVRGIEHQLEQFLGVRVRIQPRSDTSGTITFDYVSLEQFDAIVERLRV